jgi:hypothetical protein
MPDDSQLLVGGKLSRQHDICYDISPCGKSNPYASYCFPCVCYDDLSAFGSSMVVCCRLLSSWQQSRWAAVTDVISQLPNFYLSEKTLHTPSLHLGITHSLFDAKANRSPEQICC